MPTVRRFFTDLTTVLEFDALFDYTSKHRDFSRTVATDFEA